MGFIFQARPEYWSEKDGPGQTAKATATRTTEFHFRTPSDH